MAVEKITCTAHSRQTGLQCGNRPIPGGTVCRFHGGGAPQVRRAAELRLAELVAPAIATLAREMATADASADRIRAARDILDRAGVVRRTDGLSIEEAKAILTARLIAARDGTE